MVCLQAVFSVWYSVIGSLKTSLVVFIIVFINTCLQYLPTHKRDKYGETNVTVITSRLYIFFPLYTLINQLKC